MACNERLKLVSLNVRGLRSKKRFSIYKWLKINKFDIVLVRLLGSHCFMRLNLMECTFSSKVKTRAKVRLAPTGQISELKLHLVRFNPIKQGGPSNLTSTIFVCFKKLFALGIMLISFEEGGMGKFFIVLVIHHIVEW